MQAKLSGSWLEITHPANYEKVITFFNDHGVLLTMIQFGQELSPAPTESPFLLKNPASLTNASEVNGVPSSQPPNESRKIPALLSEVQLRSPRKPLTLKKQFSGGIVARSRSQECNGKE